MHLSIRPCAITDTPAIHDLNTREMGYDYPADLTKQKIEKVLASDKDKIFVAVLDGHVIGYVHANDYDVLYAPPMKNIMGIAVARRFQQQGVGKALLAAVEKWAQDTGASGVRLVSGSTRTGAHEFYRRCGYGNEKPQINFKKIICDG